jgi:hypothetical protein
MSEQHRILACVAYVHKANRGFNPHFVRLTPLLRWDDGWVRVVDPVEEYPSQGFVYWAQPKGVRLELGQAWLIDLEARAEQDTYWVRSGTKPVRPWEVVSVPGVTDLVALRRALTGGSFKLTPPPVGLALIAHPDRPDVWLAPFDARAEPDGTFPHRFATGFTGLLALDHVHFFHATIAGEPRLLVDGAALVPEPQGMFALQSDEDLVKGLLRRLRQWDQEALHAIGTTQAAFEAHARALARAALAEPPGRDEAREEAVGALLTAEVVSREDAGRLAEAVAHHPAVADGA